MVKVYLAYRCSHLFGGALEDGTEDREHLIDADTDQHALVRRVNAHYATPEQMRYERGIKHEIPAFAMKSERRFGGGGGCSTYSWLEIREAPRLPDALGVAVGEFDGVLETIDRALLEREARNGNAAAQEKLRALGVAPCDKCGKPRCLCFGDESGRAGVDSSRGGER